MHAETVRHVEFPGWVLCAVSHAGIATVISVAQRDDVVVAGVGARHEQGEIVGFRAGVDEIADLEIARHFRRELLSELGDVRVQVNGGGMLQHFVLLVRGGDHVRMAMADADRHDAAEAIEVALAGVVPDILHLALHDHDRLLVIEKNTGVQETACAAPALRRVKVRVTPG